MSSQPLGAHFLPTHAVPSVRSAGIDPLNLTRIGAGVHVLTSEWEALFGEGRLRTRALASRQRAREAKGACSHTTAAAFHRLPLYRVRSDRIDLICPGRHPRRNGPDVIRHHMPLPESDVVVIDGVRVTNLDRTVFDVIRSVPLEAATVCFDAALRRIAWDDDVNTYDAAAADDFRALVRQRIRCATGARGIRQARFVEEFADGRAQLPGESISRLWMWMLGIPAPELQHRVDLPGGTYALLDFAWPRLRRWVEFDGLIKYTEDELLAGRTAQHVRERQDERERAIRFVTGWSCDRWGFDRMPTIDAFAEHLRSIGLYGARR